MNTRQYKDPFGLTESRLNFGLWFAEKSPIFKKTTIAFLIIFSGGTLIFDFYYVTNYAILGIQQDKNIISQIQPINHNLTIQRSPVDIRTSFLQAIANKNAYDLAGEITNPNANFWCHFTYYFQWGSESSERQEGFLLPAQTKKILSINQRSASIPSNAQIILENIQWLKVDNKKYPNWPAFQNSHVNIITTGYSITQTDENNTLIEFNLLNNTAYGYYELPLNIITYNTDDQISSIFKIVIKNVKAEESRKISMIVNNQIFGGSKIEVSQDLDITKDDIYLPY